VKSESLPGRRQERSHRSLIKNLASLPVKTYRQPTRVESFINEKPSLTVIFNMGVGGWESTISINSFTNRESTRNVTQIKIRNVLNKERWRQSSFCCRSELLKEFRSPIPSSTSHPLDPPQTTEAFFQSFRLFATV
jgi:hypothetical protein